MPQIASYEDVKSGKKGRERPGGHTSWRTNFIVPPEGVVDHPVASAPDKIDFNADAAVSQRDAQEGMVLLKNDGALLPLSKSIKRIAVIGGYADKGVLAGGGSSLVYPHGGNAVPGLEPKIWPGPVMYYPSSPLKAI